jgi:hypothetical protein
LLEAREGTAKKIESESNGSKEVTMPRYILTGLNLLIWGGLVWLGLELIRTQHLRGYANAGQFQHYVTIPSIMVFVSILPPLVLWRTRWSGIGTGWAIITLLLLLPYMLAYSGGV